jgi:hypothetical protein
MLTQVGARAESSSCCISEICFRILQIADHSISIGKLVEHRCSPGVRSTDGFRNGEPPS